MELIKTAGLSMVILLAFAVAGSSFTTLIPSLAKAAFHTSMSVKKITNPAVNIPISQANISVPQSTQSTQSAQRNEEKLMATVNLNVRSGPSTSEPVLGIIKSGSIIEVQTQLSNGWDKIKYHGKAGYVSGQYVIKDHNIYKMNVPVVLQNPELPTGCEVTCLTMALNYKGVRVDKMVLAKKMPYTSTLDPNKGFVGSPFKTSGETINPVKLQELAKLYRSKSTDLTGLDINTIEQEVRAGNPVLVWYTIGYVEPKDEYLTKNGHKYWFPQPLHCIVVTGVSATSFFINDPLNGNQNYMIQKEQFNKIYTKLGKRALVVR